MQIAATSVKELRERTGAGILDCRKALEETKGDLERAAALLQEQGLAKAQRKLDRAVGQGVVEAYLHGNRIGVLVELNCESDFVARTTQFQALAKDIAMHVAASDPRYVRREDVPADALDKEREIYRAQFGQSGKPAPVVEKIVEGKLGSFYSQVVLLDQPFVRDTTLTVSQVIADATAKMGEHITVSRFSRFKVGEHPAD